MGKTRALPSHLNNNRGSPETTSVCTDVEGGVNEYSKVIAHPSGEYIVVNTEHHIHFYNATNLHKLSSHRVVEEDEYDGIIDIVVTGDGGKCLISKRRQHTAVLYDITNLDNITTTTQFTMEGREDGSYCEMWSSDIDPFSIYDDETAHDHYFFLPAGQPEVKRTCSQGEKSGCWSRNKPLIDKRTKPPDIRSQRANTCPSNTDTAPSCHRPVLQKNDAQQNARNSRRAPNRTTTTTTTTTTPAATTTTTTTTNQRHSLKTKDGVYGGGGGGRGSSMSGDYCSLSVHAVAPHYPTMIRSQRDPPIDEDKFRKFAHNLIRTTNVIM